MEVSYITDQKNPETIINLKSLSLQIPTLQQQSPAKPINILNQTDLTIQKGKKFGLIGRNGQGKSTLMNTLKKTVNNLPQRDLV